MKRTVWTCEYKLKKGTCEEEFLAASKLLGVEYISQQKGYVSWQQLKCDGIWVDVLTWESLEDAKTFESSGGGGDLAQKFYSFINLTSCKTRYHTLERMQEDKT
ncbi:MAG: hypothetical protein FWE13_00870 [Firmicutes bacterium]|nr:hypothetical protein [Bacillota bacterium]